MRNMLTAALLGAALLALPASAAQTITVHVVNFDYTDTGVGGAHFDPTIQVGDTIHWVWDTSHHTVQTVAGSAESFNSGVQNTPFTFDHTFTTAGDIVYFCSIHGADAGNGTATGMAGKIHVMAAAQNKYVQTNLVSDVTGLATHKDPNLVNAWGLDKTPTGPWWVNSNGKGLSLLYDGAGAINPLVVTVPPAPPNGPPGPATGIVYNPTSAFQIAVGSPSLFLFVTEDGSISGWNPAVSANSAVLKVNRTGQAVYKGLALGQINTANVLYAANFFSGGIEVFDGAFNALALNPAAFKDAAVPAGYGPFNVQNIGGKIYVTWAKQDAAKHDEVAGAGLGYVSIFTMAGKLTGRLQHGNWLNAPWGLAMAPNNFGVLSNTLLVGQFGSGTIVAFDPATGKVKDVVKNTSGATLKIPGLWGLSFGNGTGAGPANTLYFAAGIANEAHGLFGSLTAQ
jgi:uncharacterized protein (TIGR03118 family)